MLICTQKSVCDFRLHREILKPPVHINLKSLKSVKVSNIRIQQESQSSKELTRNQKQKKIEVSQVYEFS